MMKAATALGLLTAIVFAAVALVSGDSANPASAGNGEMEAMSVDVITDGNTATELGERNNCVEVEAGSDVTIDVTALNIPAGNPMIAFNYNLMYDADNLSVTASNHDFLLGSLQGSDVLDAGDPVPDADGDYNGTAADVAAGDVRESGSGVLSRLTISVDAATSAGGYLLTLDRATAAHVGPDNDGYSPQSIFDAQLAVGVTCDSLPPPPTPAPFLQGDVNCDGNVNALDALQDLRFFADLPLQQTQPCPEIGEDIGGFPFGDVNCDGNVNALDALQILRHFADLPVQQNAGCQPIGA